MHRISIITVACVCCSLATATATAQETPKTPSDTGWKFDGDIGVPSLGGSEFSLDFDVTLGYIGDVWGTEARFAQSTYTLASGEVLSSTGSTAFAVDGWYTFMGSKKELQWDARLSAQFSSYNTAYIETGNTGDFNTEGSSLSRLTALVGFHTPTDDALSFGLRAGLGFQSETYAKIGSSLEDDGSGFQAQTSTRLVARGDATWQWMPGTLNLRVESELSTYTIRRAAILFGDTADDLAAIETVLGVESKTRLAGDWKSVSLMGLTPSAFIGLDVIALSGDSGSNNTLVPLIGVGLITL